MAVLKAAGLVTVEKRGLWGFYSLNPGLPPAAGRILDSLLESA
jgi:DNA-binding transcriptional ArsR family regulator